MEYLRRRFIRPRAGSSVVGMLHHTAPTRHLRRRINAVAVLAVVVAVAVIATLATPDTGAATPRASSPLVTNCDGGSWSTSHLMVWGSGCEALFGVIYANNFSNTNWSQSYNFSFMIPYVAEVNGSGGLVRLADPMNPGAASTTVTSVPGEVNVSLDEQVNVTSADGVWTPNDTLWGSGPQWTNGTAVLGVTTLAVDFHLFNASPQGPANGSYRVKFDLNIAGWPWASRSDSLGIGLQALGAGGAHFAYVASANTLAESWNANDAPFVNLTFGNVAGTTSASGATGTAQVGVDAGLFAGGTPDRQAVTLLTFQNTSGGYSQLSYDPWVAFSGPSSSPIQGVNNSGPPLGDARVVALAPYLALGGIVAVAAGGASVVRRRQLRRDGEALVRGIEQLIEHGPREPQ